MGKIRFLKVLGISLFLFASLFFTANRSLAEKPWIELGNIDESADDAQYIKWEIKAEKAYDVVVYMEDDDGNEFSIVFRTRDDENEYGTSDNDRLVVGIGKEDDYYFDDTKRIYESKSFTYLTSKHSSANSSITYNFDDDTTVNTIRIYGEDFKLYSITLADNDYFDDLCWEREGSDWGNLWNFENDNGKISDDTSINFSSSYIHVTEKETSPYFPVFGGIYGGLYGMYGSSYYGGPGPGYGIYGSSYYGGSYRAPGTSAGYGMYGNYYRGYSSGGYTPPPPWTPQYLSTGGGSYSPMNPAAYYEITGHYDPTYRGYGGLGYSGWGGPIYGGYGSSGYSGWGGPTYRGYGGYGPSSGYSGGGGPAYGGYNPGWGYPGWGNW